MRSSGSNSGSGSGRSGGSRNPRGGTGSFRPKSAGQGRDDKKEQRPRKPRPEERRYDVGSDKPGGIVDPHLTAG
jgi:hypothetical protein